MVPPACENGFMKTVKLENTIVELSQPLPERPDVILIQTDDGRTSIIGDGQDPFTAKEYRQMDRQSDEYLPGVRDLS